MTKQAIGTNLSAWKSPLTRDLTNGFDKLFNLMETKAALDTPLVSYIAAHRFFTKKGVPVASTAADSPGTDICFIWDITGNDLYLVYDWVNATSFSVQLIVGTA
jgi:hypothetical protein